MTATERAEEWTERDVVRWAAQVKLSAASIQALADNEVDGPTLVSLTREELRAELGIKSLAARRYIWDLIENLRAQQADMDHQVALQFHGTEIRNLTYPDSENVKSLPAGVIEILRSDAEIERQILEDHMLAHRLANGLAIGQQMYEDSTMANDEQMRADEQAIQAEYDHQFALSLNPRAAAQQARQATTCKSLFALCVEACIKNRINVAEALSSQQVKPIELLPSNNLVEEDEESKTPSYATEGGMEILEECDVCFSEKEWGFQLHCGHRNCSPCMRKLLQTALTDITLLPLTCCEIPINTTVPMSLLKKDEAELLEARTEELAAVNKMYCPACSRFVNLDKVRSQKLVISCPHCTVLLCTGCASKSHPTITCEQNKAALEHHDEAFLDLSRDQGWKQCPKCTIMIELKSGCNHMACATCQHQFCFRCLQPWDANTGQCSTGRCAVWDETRLVEGGERRVREMEEAQGAAFAPEERPQVVQHAMDRLQMNEGCRHNWQKQYLRGECEHCGYDLWMYGYVCNADCGATVCYTCRFHRLPRRGWV